MIQEGRISVNGKVVKTQGVKIDIQRDKIRLDNKLLKGPQPSTYLLFYKPKGCITSMKEEGPRPAISQYLDRIKVRVFPVGRLDYDAEGILLLTNDGELAKVLSHPRYNIPRRYLVKLRGVPSLQKLTGLKRGIKLEDGLTRPATAKLGSITKAGNCWVDITVWEGRNRLIKRMFQHIGYPVLKLKRVRFSFLGLAGLSPGQYRYLTPSEIIRLHKITEEKIER
jgi:23S rRNA pseudouridine2605 synthase